MWLRALPHIPLIDELTVGIIVEADGLSAPTLKECFEGVALRINCRGLLGWQSLTLLFKVGQQAVYVHFVGEQGLKRVVLGSTAHGAYLIEAHLNLAGLLNEEGLTNKELHHRPDSQNEYTINIRLALKTEATVMNYSGIGILPVRRCRKRREIYGLILKIPTTID